MFALEVADAGTVLDAIAGPDPSDPLARSGGPCGFAEPVRLGVPRSEDLAWLGGDGYATCWESWLLRETGGMATQVLVGPFPAAAELLYAGPWLAERVAAVGDFVGEHPEAVWPGTRQIIEGGRRFSAVDAFRGHYRLAELSSAVRAVFAAIDVLVVPTAPGHPTLAEIAAEPLTLNARLGRWTNFVNLLDLAAVAVPWSMTEVGLPFGLTLIAPAFSDRALADLAERLQRVRALPLGATAAAQSGPSPDARRQSDEIALFVVGAHLSGQPLHHELQRLGARFGGPSRTACCYRLYALDLLPERPGLVRVARGQGAVIEGELWQLEPEAFGRFVASVPQPMAIGTVELENGRLVKGFACESEALRNARDITSFGGWRAYLRGKG